MKTDPPRTLDISTQLSWLRRRPLLLGAVEHLLGFRRINQNLATIDDADQSDPESYLGAVLRAFDIEFEPAGPWDQLPREGALIVVSNHPLGGPDALALSCCLSRVRKDTRLIANEFLEQMEPLRDFVIPVEILEISNETKQRNSGSLRESLAHLKAGGTIGLFPSGIVSHRPNPGDPYVEAPWEPLLGSLAKRTGATIVPVFISGRTSFLFSLLGWIYPFLRTAWLGRELLRMRGRSLKLTIGTPVNYDQNSSGERITEQAFQAWESLRSMS